MNSHRTAITALLAAARDERGRAVGPNSTDKERARLDDRIATLESALTSGDEGEAGEADTEWNEDIRAGVEARFEIDALRRSLARALGRRMFTRALFSTGPEQDVPPPADAVMLSEVEALLRKGREHEAMVNDLRTALHLAHGTTGERVLAVLRERVGNAEAAERHLSEAETRGANLERLLDEARLSEAEARGLAADGERLHDRLVYALHVLAGAEDVDRLPTRDLLLRVADCTADPQTLDRALATLRDPLGDTETATTRED